MGSLGRALAILALAAGLLWARGATGAVVVDAASAIPLAGEATAMHDPSGVLDIEAVRRLAGTTDFAPLPTARASLGYREGATWIHLDLHNGTGRPLQRWLEYGIPLIQSATLFVLRSDGSLQRLDNGAQVPVPERPLATRNLLFPLALATDETASLFLRVETRTTTIIDLTLWEPAAFADANAVRNAAVFVTTGAGFMVIVFSLLAWQVRRVPGLLGLAFAQLCIMLVAPLLEGLFAGVLPIGDGLMQPRLTWMLVLANLAGQAFFSHAFLQLPSRHPRLAQLMVFVGGFSLLLVPLTALLFQPRLLAVTTTVIVSVFACVIVGGGWRFGTTGRVFFAAWALVWLSIAMRMAQQLGMLAQIPFIGVAPLLSFSIADLVLSYAIYLDIRNFRRESDIAHRQLLQLKQTEQERLQSAVDVRTQELQEAIRRAEAANQAKSAFLSIVSHELRTPLHTILGYTQLLQRQLAGEARDKLGIIGNSSSQLLRLIDDILDFSRGEAVPVELQLEPINLNALIGGLEASARVLAGRRGNSFDVIREGPLPTAVEADEQRLTQVLQNLIGNACKYTERGRIGLHLATDCAPVTTADGIWHRLRLTVSDSGPGIPVAEQEHIFEPFTRASDRQRQPGAGLGLAIARQLARAMGGNITVDSAPGAGSQFHVILPLRELPGESVPERRSNPDMPPRLGGRSLTLLVADDIIENRTILKEMFIRLGFSVVTARDGEEALARCIAAAPPIDAALVDQFMPVRDGWGFLRAVRSDPRFAELPVILISAAPAERPADFPPGMDFDLKLMKPVRLDALASLLQHRLGFEWAPSGDATAPAPEPTPTPAPIVYPATEKLDEFRDLLALGKVLALQRWAQREAVAAPAHAACYERIGTLARAVDLAGLKNLLDAWEAAAR